MKTLRFILSPVVLFLILKAPALRAQSIPNPGFEADSFSVYPGYASQNGGLSGWTFTGGVGLNPASGNPFANNGAIPQGGNVAFIQSSNSTLETLGTTITGLTPGATYVVRFRANSREGYPVPASTWTVNGRNMPFFSSRAGNATTGYLYFSANFTATAATAALTINNRSPVDTTLLVDDFSIAPAPPATSAWTVSPWTGDATSGISPQMEWAWRFGSTTTLGINGNGFSGVDGPNPAFPGLFAVTGVPYVFTGDNNSLTAAGGIGSAELAKNFIWGGNPATVTLFGLIPGHTYVASLFSVGWDPVDHRILTFSSGAQEFVVDQDLYGDNNGLRVEHMFVADAATRVITITPQDPGFTFHLYGIALLQPILVSNTDDNGTGSLRRAIADALDSTGPDLIVFDPGLSGRTITFGSVISINDPNRVVIDASTLPGGLTLGNSGGHKHFDILAGTNLTLRGLTVANGGGNFGGAIYSAGDLTLTRCTFFDNSGLGGGALYNAQGTLTLTDCTLSGNSAVGYGGAISNYGNTTLTRCTLSGNSVSYKGSGGAIFHDLGNLTLDHCTLPGNSAFTSDDEGGVGGAIYAYRGGNETLTHCTLFGNFATLSGGAIDVGTTGNALTLKNSIVAANTSASGADIHFSGGLIRTGANVIQSVVNAGGGSESGPAAITFDPLLAPLANYGGLTPTMALRPGSPALNASSGSTILSDQRGFPIVSVPDIGAYEAGTFTNCASRLAETFPSAVPAALVGPAGDFDGDGESNEQEWNALTDSASASSFFRILSAVRSGANLVITFPTVVSRNYTLWRSEFITGAWTDTGLTPVAGNGANQTFSLVVPSAGAARCFYRVQAGP